MHFSSYNRCATRITQMDLRHLRGFVTIADAGSFGRAGVRLNVSQPALSRQIRALEGELGIQLFDRVGRRVQLTPEGEDLLPRVRRLLTDVESLGERARALKGGEAGVLRVGATPQLLETLLAGFLPRYRRAHPGVEVHLIEDGGVRVATRLEQGDVQVAVTASADARFPWRPLMPLYVLAVMPKSLRLARRATLELEDLVDEPLLLTRREFASREWFDTACQLGHMRPRVLLESGAPSTLVAMAQARHGIAIVPSSVRIPQGRLRALPVVQRKAPIGRWLSLAWDPRRYLPPYAKEFVDELTAYAQGISVTPHYIRRAPPLPRPKEQTSPQE
jgi:LysR family cyn operon transcriptional activator